MSLRSVVTDDVSRSQEGGSQNGSDGRNME